MISSSRFNYLIEITHKLTLAVVKMRAAYADFPRLIDEEHAMIYSHTYTMRLETLCHEKTRLSEIITESFEELQQLSQQIFNIWGDMECEGTAAYPGDLSNCVKMLEGIHWAIVERNTDLASAVLELQIAKFREEFLSFKTLSSAIRPKIEMNRSALSGVVRSYQESTRVLFELCERAQATYSPQGTQNKASAGVSTIIVRA
jgi:hypothetical protein